MKHDSFGGDRKAPMRSPLADIERRFIQENVHRFPSWIESHHLTLLTVLWTLGLIGFGWLARGSIHWLWMSSLMLFLQWLTDSFDGSLGKYRDQGLVKWGFYMDHFLDFLFMSSIFIGYAFLVDGVTLYLTVGLMLLYGAAMVHSFLMFAITNEFQITYNGIGPTEVRLLFILLNTLILIGGVEFLDGIMPFLFVLGLLGLTIMVYGASRQTWAMDMAAKAERQT